MGFNPLLHLNNGLKPVGIKSNFSECQSRIRYGEIIGYNKITHYLTFSNVSKYVKTLLSAISNELSASKSKNSRKNAAKKLIANS
jgi:hypothetical protein